MLQRVSEVAQKLIGIYLPEAPPSISLLANWLEAQCRYGVLASEVQKFAIAQPEVLDMSRVRIEKVTEAGLMLVFPCRMYERECLDRPLDTDVSAWLDLKTGCCQRVELTPV